MIDWGRAQPTVGDATPGQLVLAGISKQAEQASKHAVSWFLHHVLPSLIDGVQPELQAEVSAFLP